MTAADELAELEMLEEDGDHGDLRTSFKVHRAVCAQRQGYILKRLGRIENILISIAGAIVVGMVAALWTLLQHRLTP